MTLDDELLEQRVATALSLFPECAENDTALVFRVACLYGASTGMDAESSFTLPKTYRIKRTMKKVLNGGRNQRASS